jgi:cysteinyl-tRNA synthetase
VEQLRKWDSVLGLIEEAAGGGTELAAVETLIRERDAARARKDFAESDRIRKLLQAQGFTVKDTPQGTRVHRTDS